MKGVYLIGYIKTSDIRILKSASLIKKSVLKVCRAMGFNVVGENYHLFKTHHGITYCFILSQSHFTVHTWPEESRIFFDIFACNASIDEKKCIEVLSKEFKGKAKEIKKAYYK